MPTLSQYLMGRIWKEMSRIFSFVLIDTNDLQGEAKASSVKVEDVRPCSRKRGYSCFPVVIRFCILLVLSIYSKEIEKNLRKRRSSFLLGVSKDDEFLAK